GFAAGEVVADFRPDDVGDPIHDAVLSSAYMDRLLMAGNCEENPRYVALSRTQPRLRALGLSAKPKGSSPSNSVGVSLVRARSIVSRRSLVATPPLAEKPPDLPPAPRTRSHRPTPPNASRPTASP